MRILVLTEYLPVSDRGEITGGVEAYCHYVGRHLEEQGHDVEFISRPTDGSVWEHASAASIPKRLWFLAGALVRGVRAEADVVVGTTYVVHLLAWFVAKVRRRPVVFWYPDVLVGTWRGGQFGRLAGVIGEAMERLLLRLPVDRFIAISESTASKLRQQGVADDRISVIPCGVDPEVIDAVETDRPAGRRLMSVGRLVGYKRTDVIVRAFARLRDQRPDLELVIVGQGPERARLEQLAEELGVADGLHLLGFVETHADVLGLVAGATAFVTASEIEGFGIVLVEAMALGTPFAATDIPAFREVTGGGQGGVLFSPGDDAGLAMELTPILDDAELRSRLALAGRARAEQFHWSEIARQTAAALSAVVGAH